MSTKPVCQVTHPQIRQGRCPWCEEIFAGDDKTPTAEAGRSGTCSWNIEALEQGINDPSSEVRSTTIANLMGDDGPGYATTIRLLAAGIHDDNGEIRNLAESALSSLGRDMPEAEAVRLESQPEGSPYRLAVTMVLLAYYFLRQHTSDVARDARHQHILWIIEQAPASNTAGRPYALVLKREDEESYAEVRRLWLKQVDDHPSEARILGNAAQFFMLNDRTLSEQLFKRAKALEPNNPYWAQQLGHLYSLQDGKTADQRRGFAAQSLEEFEASERIRSTRPREPAQREDPPANGEENFRAFVERIYALPFLAKAAFAAGKVEQARELATELLLLADEEELSHNGNAIHYSHLVLGQCAFEEGDVEQAKSHLLASGRTDGSPNLRSFGPNMSLAKSLLEVGERDAVLEYFDLCRSFWHSHATDLQQWTEEVERGEIPDFGANLRY